VVGLYLHGGEESVGRMNLKTMTRGRGQTHVPSGTCASRRQALKVDMVYFNQAA
jgi:hypothetical protein